MVNSLRLKILIWNLLFAVGISSVTGCKAILKARATKNAEKHAQICDDQNSKDDCFEKLKNTFGPEFKVTAPADAQIGVPFEVRWNNISADSGLNIKYETYLSRFPGCEPGAAEVVSLQNTETHSFSVEETGIYHLCLFAVYEDQFRLAAVNQGQQIRVGTVQEVTPSLGPVVIRRDSSARNLQASATIREATIGSALVIDFAADDKNPENMAPLQLFISSKNDAACSGENFLATGWTALGPELREEKDSYFSWSTGKVSAGTYHVCVRMNHQYGSLYARTQHPIVFAIGSDPENELPPITLEWSAAQFNFTFNVAIPATFPELSASIAGCSVEPDLPAGLTISSSNCAISGTPTESIPMTQFTVTAVNGGRSGSSTIGIVVHYPSSHHRYSGAGTKTNPFLIGSVEQWASLAATAEDYDKFFALTANLDFSSYANPDPVIGMVDTPFTGNFDGRERQLLNWQHVAPTTDAIAPFGRILGAHIYDLQVSEVIANGKEWVGGLVGNATNSSIQGIVTSGTVTAATQRAGGIVGHLTGSNINRSSTSANVSGPAAVGGLVGRSYGSEIHHSFASGAVAGQQNAGGLVGENSYEGRITNSYASGDVDGSGGSNIGGLIGYCESCFLVSNTFSNGTVTGDTNSGGLVGRNTGTIRNSFTTSDVNGAGANIGSVVGSGNGLTNVYRTSEAGCDADRNSGGVQACNSTYSGTHATQAHFHSPSNAPLSSWDFSGTGADGTDDAWISTGSAFPTLALPSSPGPASWSGEGTSLVPFLITNADDWNAIGSNVRWMRSHFRLSADLDFAIFSYNRIGKDSTFFGTIDGAGHTIRNITLTTDIRGTGLIDEVGTGGKISNLTVSDLSFTAPSSAGLLVGVLLGELENIRVNGTLTGGNNLGGIVMELRSGKITKAAFDGTVTAGGQSTSGGIASVVSLGSHIDQCSVKGTVTGGNNYNGGIAGYNAGTIENCYFDGDMTGVKFTGGLVGQNVATGKISKSYVTGTVASVGNTTAGGLVGTNAGSVEDCFVLASITAESGTDETVGVMFSDNTGSVSRNYYWSGLTCDADSLVGGIQACNVDGSAGNHALMNQFYLPTTAPLNVWNFESIWQSNNAALPILKFE